MFVIDENRLSFNVSKKKKIHPFCTNIKKKLEKVFPLNYIYRASGQQKLT